MKTVFTCMFICLIATLSIICLFKEKPPRQNMVIDPFEKEGKILREFIHDAQGGRRNRINQLKNIIAIYEKNFAENGYDEDELEHRKDLYKGFLKELQTLEKEQNK